MTNPVPDVLKMFSMSDDKIAVLPSLKPLIKDAYNKMEIIGSFSFQGDRDRAEEILRNCKVRFKPKVPPESEVQKVLRRIGRYPAGYAWRQCSGGWRCAAGGHWVTDAAIQKEMDRSTPEPAMVLFC